MEESCITVLQGGRGYVFKIKEKHKESVCYLAFIGNVIRDTY